MALTFRSPVETIAVHSIRSASLNAMVRSIFPVASRMRISPERKHMHPTRLSSMTWRRAQRESLAGTPTSRACSLISSLSLPRNRLIGSGRPRNNEH